MAKEVNIEIKAKPVVAQYIHNNYGTPPIFPPKNAIKCMTLAMLERNSARFDNRISLQHYTSSFIVPISFEQYERCGLELSKTNTIIINTVIEALVHERLFMFYEFFHHIAGLTIKDTAIKFQEVYSFPEEIYSIDNITKQFQRWIKPELDEKSIGANVLRSVSHNKKGGNNITKASAQRVSAFREAYIASK